MLDVIIIGAGFAGLKAATELKAAGKNVKLLEARERVGGRVKAGKIAGEVIDLGGQWVGPQQKNLMAEAATQGVEIYPQYDDGKTVMEMNGVRRLGVGSNLPLSWAASIEMLRIIRHWDKTMRTLPAAAPWQAPNATQWDGETVESWINRNVWTKQAREFISTLTRALICAEPNQVSYLCFLNYLRSGHGLEVLIGTRGGAQQDKFRGGAWSIAGKMAEKLSDDIIFQAPVQAISQSDNDVTIHTEKGDFTAARAIIAIPPVLAGRIRYNQPLSRQREGLVQRMPMGAVIKIHIAYDKPFWRHEGLSGTAISNQRGFNVVLDQSPEDESKGILVGFFDGGHALRASGMGDNQRRTQVLEDLQAYFGDKAAQPIDYVEQNWLAEEWSLGGYVSHTGPGVLTAYGEALRRPCGRLHWAGTETATEWAGYIDGALQSGVRVAEEVKGLG